MPLPPFEQQPEKPESHEKPTWLWEKASEKEEKPDSKEKKEPKKKPEKEKEEKKEPPKKEEEPEKKAEPEEEKRERRATLVEQSIALVAKYEEEPIPRDATTLARLMIAHQVIHLNNQLEQPDNEHPLAPEEIEATLDYITQLDEKLKNPDTKAEPAIEQSYQEVMELAEATLEQESDLEKVIASMDVLSTPNSSKPAGSEPYTHLSTEGMSPSRASRAPWAGSQPPIKRPERGDGGHTANRTTTDQDQPDIPIQDKFDRRMHATRETIPAITKASALIYLITHLGRKKPKKEPDHSNIANGDYSASDIRSNQSPSVPHLYDTPDRFRIEQPPPSTYPPYINSTRTERTTPAYGREHVTVPRYASTGLAAAAVTTTLAVTHDGSKTPSVTATSSEAYRASSELARPEFSNPSPIPAPSPEDVTTRPQRKIEHMPLLQLLSMAENVDIGHGRYLRREFESGRIDKEGLVKILKAHSKGRDYHFEFRQQAGRFANLKQTSPEFLHQAKPLKTVSTDNATEEQQIESKPETNKKEDISAISRPLSLAPPTQHDLLPEVASSIHQPEHTGRRLALITVATAAGLALIGWLAVTIFNALS